MLMAGQGLQLTGDRALMRALHALPIKVYKRVARSAVKAALRPVKTAGKQACDARSSRGKEKPSERKARQERGIYRLSESIDVVARTYKGGETAIGVVGPIVGKHKSGKRRGQTRFRGVGHLGHLIEHGHKKVLWGRRTGGWVEGSPFMRPAWDANKSRVQQVLIAKLRAGIEREARKARQESGR